MFKFFKKPEDNSGQSKKAEDDSGQSFDDLTQQQNAVATGLLRDFPWLWAIRNHHSWNDGDYTKVSQDMTDLRLVLAQPSNKTRFSIWAITSQACGAFNMRAVCLERLDGNMWAEAVMQHTSDLASILYLVMVDPLWGEEHPTRRITIFRHPEKKPLNGLVEQVCQLHGSNARWLISKSYD